MKSGQKIRLTPVGQNASVVRDRRVPALQDIPHAGTVHLREITVGRTQGESRQDDEKIQAKLQQWLTLLVRESLGQFAIFTGSAKTELVITVDLRYISSTQIVEVPFQGRSRLFVVSDVIPGSSATNAPQSPSFVTPRTPSRNPRLSRSTTEELRDAVRALNITDEATAIDKVLGVWLVNWDTQVVMETPEENVV